jgi:hypothetical protein
MQARVRTARKDNQERRELVEKLRDMVFCKGYSIKSNIIEYKLSMESRVLTKVCPSYLTISLFD